MKGTSNLAWRHLVSVIHPPLPLSGQDSQRLLSLLNKSFSKALDREHPDLFSRRSAKVDEHIRSVLDSPHFASERFRSEHGDISYWRPSDIAQNFFLSKAGSVAGYTADFKNNVAAGTASIKMAMAYVNTAFEIQKVINKQQDETMDKQVASAQLGSAVAHWLWSSGLDTSLSTFERKTFISGLIRLLILEYNTDPIWRWLKFLNHEYEKTLLPGKPNSTLAEGHRTIQALRHIISRFVPDQYRVGYGLNAAVESFLTLLESFDESKHSPELELIFRKTSDNLTRLVLRDAGQSPIYAPNHAAFRKWIARWKDEAGFSYAVLQLYNPRKPEAAFAHDYVTLYISQQASSKDDQIERQYIVRLGLAAVKILFASKKRKNIKRAQSLIHDLKGNFEGIVGDTTQLKGVSNDSVVRSLRSLMPLLSLESKEIDLIAQG